MIMDTSTLGAGTNQEVDPPVIKEEPEDVEDEFEEVQNDDKEELLPRDQEYYDITKTEPEENCPSSPLQTIAEIPDAFQESHERGANRTPRAKQTTTRKLSTKKKKTISKRRERQTPNASDTVDFAPHYDVSMQEPNDIIIKPESLLNCPPSMQNFSEDEIFNAFRKCYKTARRSHTPAFNHRSAKSMYGKISMFLTETKSSTLIERKYLYDLWTLKYKNMLTTEADDLKKHFSKYAKSSRRKHIQRLKYHQQSTLGSVEVVYDNRDEKGGGSDGALPSESLSAQDNENFADANDYPVDSKIMDSETAIAAPKTEVESYGDAEFDFAPSSPSPLEHDLLVDRNDSKLKVKPVIALVRLDLKTLPKGDKAEGRTLRCRKRIRRRKYADGDNSSFTGGSNLDNDDDDDYVPCNKPLPVKGTALGEPGDNNGDQDDSKTACKVCGRPLDKFLIPFHMRTHLNYEEQKQFILTRKEEMRAIEKKNIQNGISIKKASVSRLEQLQWLIAGREKRIEQMQNQQNPRPKRDRRRKRDRPKVIFPKVSRKVDGKYLYGPVQCSDCGKVLKTIYLLRSHEVCVHGSTEGNSCPCFICGRPYSWKNQRTDHMSTHFSMEERIKFAAWSGTIEEFINRLNNDEDLDKPPTEKPRTWKRRNKGESVPRFKRLRRPPGRPRKHHHLYEKKDDNNFGPKEGGPLQSAEDTLLRTGTGNNDVSNLESSINSNEFNDNSGVDDSRGSDVSERVFPTSSLEASISEFSWNTYPYQSTDGFHSK